MTGNQPFSRLLWLSASGRCSDNCTPVSKSSPIALACRYIRLRVVVKFTFLCMCIHICKHMYMCIEICASQWCNVQYLEKYNNQAFFSLHLQDPRPQQAISNFVCWNNVFFNCFSTNSFFTRQRDSNRNMCVFQKRGPYQYSLPWSAEAALEGQLIQVASKSFRTWLPEATLLTPISRERLPQLIIFRELAGCVGTVMDKLTSLGPESKKELALSQRKSWTWVKERFS